MNDGEAITAILDAAGWSAIRRKIDMDGAVTFEFPEFYGYGQGTELKNVVTLEAIRNVEMVAMGRAYIDEGGSFHYESRFHRSLPGGP